MEIVLIRHAQPEWEPQGRAVDDPGLTKRGRRQAWLTANLLKGEHFDAIYASPLVRVRQTVAPIAETLRAEPRFQPWLREIGLPSLEGKTETEVREYFRRARARDFAEWWDGMPGGESFRHFYERVSGGMEALLSDEHEVGIHAADAHRLWRIPNDDLRLLIVAHEGTNSVILSHLLGIEPIPWTWVRFSSAWSGVTHLHTIEVAGGSVWSLEWFNRVGHLAEVDDPHVGDGRTRSM
jgi:broad specificity phosphatase PhoE